jgi:ribosomal protein L27
MFKSLLTTIQQNLLFQSTKRWATKKSAAAKARQKRPPIGKRIGLKKYPGEFVGTGNVIVKQRGTKNHPGKNVKLNLQLMV